MNASIVPRSSTFPLKEPRPCARISVVRVGFERFGLTGDGPEMGPGRTDHFPGRRMICPEDLREWITEAELARLVEGAVRRIGAEATANRTGLWDVLLGILAYFYATGLYVSDEIENALNATPAMAQVHTLAFGNARPAAVLRAFRRANRTAIEKCIAELLRSASSRKGEVLSLHDVAFGSDAFKTEASARLTRAVQADSWALDL